MRASEHAEALLLRSVDYGESDRIVTLLSHSQGKLSLLARGARRSKRRFAGALEPFSLLDVQLSFGRGELGALHGAQVTRSFPRILRELSRLSVAGSAFTLVRELLPERAPDPAVFMASVALLEMLDAGNGEPMALLLSFQAHVLSLCGFAPRLSACGACGKRPAQGRSADFDAARGYLVCQDCGGAAYRLSGALRTRLSLASEDWLQAAQATWTGEELQVCERMLAAFIEHRIDRPIAKNALLDSARRKEQ